MNKHLYFLSVFFSSIANFIIAPSIIIYLYDNFDYSTDQMAYIVNSKTALCLVVTFFISIKMFKFTARNLMILGQGLRVISFLFAYYLPHGVIVFFLLFSIGSIFYRSASKAYLLKISSDFRRDISLRVKVQNIATIIGPILVIIDDFEFGFFIILTTIITSILSFVSILLLYDDNTEPYELTESESKKIDYRNIILPLLASISFSFPLAQLDYLIPTSLNLLEVDLALPAFFLIQSILVVSFQKQVLLFYNEKNIDIKFAFSLPLVTVLFFLLFVYSLNYIYFLFFMLSFAVMEIVVSPEVDVIVSKSKLNKNQAFFYVSGMTSIFILILNIVFGYAFLFNDGVVYTVSLAAISTFFICFLTFYYLNKEGSIYHEVS